MTSFMQFVITGLSIGYIYGIIALGFVIIFNATDIVNLAQGEFVMLGAGPPTHSGQVPNSRRMVSWFVGSFTTLSRLCASPAAGRSKSAGQMR